MIIYVRGESVMTFIEWLKDCNEADPLTKKVYICNDYLNAERMLENASGENIVIRLERYTVADHAKHIIETSAEYMDSRIITLSNAEGCEIVRRIIDESGINYFKSDDHNACMEIFKTISELRMNCIGPDSLSLDSRRINTLSAIFQAYENKLSDSKLYDSAKLISKNSIIDLKWINEDGKLKLFTTDKDGNEKIVKLNPGKTWIGWISANNGGSLNI